MSRDQFEAIDSEKEPEEDEEDDEDPDDKMDTNVLAEKEEKEEIQSDKDSGAESTPEKMVQDPVDDQYEPLNDITAALRQTRNADRNKGRAITRQLVRFNLESFVSHFVAGHLGLAP